jgi:hypothetical protein
VSKDKGYVTDADYTSETRWSVEISFGETRPLRTMLPNIAEGYIPGRYALERHHVHGGLRIYLFPSHDYGITDACCEGYEETLELGHWAFSEGLITLEPGRNTPAWSAGRGGSIGRLQRSAGNYQALRFFVIAKGEFIDASVLVAEDQLGDSATSVVPALVRDVEYPDWPKTLRRLEENVTKEEEGPRLEWIPAPTGEKTVKPRRRRSAAGCRRAGPRSGRSSRRRRGAWG